MTSFIRYYSNITTNYTNMTLPDGRPSLMYDDSVISFYVVLRHVITPVMFAVIIVVGTVGNLLVIYVILSRVSMQTTTNFLLMNLALSDLAFLILVAPVTAYKYAITSWSLGDVACKVICYVIYVCAYVTVYTLKAVSALRYVTVVHGLSTARYRTRINIVIITMVVWLVVMIANIPTVFGHQLKVYDEHFSYCGLVASWIKPFYLTFFLFGYGLPLVVISILYVIIVAHLHRASSSTVGQTRRRTVRASKVIALVVVVFAVLWLPLHVNQLLSVYGRVPDGHWYEVYRVLANCLAYGNSCANPIIYNFVSVDFRRAFRQLACCKSTPAEGRNVNTKKGSNTERTSVV